MTLVWAYWVWSNYWIPKWQYLAAIVIHKFWIWSKKTENYQHRGGSWTQRERILSPRQNLQHEKKYKLLGSMPLITSEQTRNQHAVFLDACTECVWAWAEVFHGLQSTELKVIWEAVSKDESEIVETQIIPTKRSIWRCEAKRENLSMRQWLWQTKGSDQSIIL